MYCVETSMPEIERDVKYTKREIFRWAYSLDYRTRSDRALMVALARRSDNEGCCFPTCEQLADDTGLSLRSVHRSVKRLMAVGAIRRELRHGKKGKRISSFYVLNVGFQVNFYPESEGGEGGNPEPVLTAKNEASNCQNGGCIYKHLVRTPLSYQEGTESTGSTSLTGNSTVEGGIPPGFDPLPPPCDPTTSPLRVGFTPVRRPDHSWPTTGIASDSKPDVVFRIGNGLSATRPAKKPNLASTAILAAFAAMRSRGVRHG